MESSDVVSLQKPLSLPPNYVSLAQLQEQWLKRKEEKRLAEERLQEEKRMAEERQEREKRMAEERRQKEKRMAEERRQKEMRMAEERQRKEKQKLSETVSRSEVRERKERGSERVQWRRGSDGTHLTSEEFTVGAPAADNPVAEVGGNRKSGNWKKKKGARVSENLTGEEKCGAWVEFGDKGFEGKIQIAGTGVSNGQGLPRIDAHEDSGDNVGGGGNLRNVQRRRKGSAPMNGKTEGVFMTGNGRLKEKTEMKSQAFDGKEMASGDPSVKIKKDSRREENVVGEGGSVIGNGWRKKKIERGSQACGDEEMVSGNLSMKARSESSIEGNVALRKGNAELLKANTDKDSSVNVGRKRGIERSRNGYQRKSGDAKESKIESGHADNVAKEGLLVGGNETGKEKTKKGSQAFGDKGMVSDNLSTKIKKDSAEESSEGNMSVKKGKFCGNKRRTAFVRIGDRDGEVVGGIRVISLEVVPESKGKEVTLQGDKGLEEVQIPVAENGVDQVKLEVVSERRRAGGRFGVKADRREKSGGSRDSKMELGLEVNVGNDGVLVEGNEGKMEKTEMGSQTYGDADVLLGNISTKIEKDLSSLSLNESSEGNVALRRKHSGRQRKPRAATGVTGLVWVKKREISEPSIAEN